MTVEPTLLVTPTPAEVSREDLEASCSAYLAEIAELREETARLRGLLKHATLTIIAIAGSVDEYIRARGAPVSARLQRVCGDMESAVAEVINTEIL